MQDLIAVALGGLVLGAFLQLGGAYGLPVLLTGVAGLAVTAALAVRYARERAAAMPAGPSPVLDVRPDHVRWILPAIVLAALALRLYTLMDRPAWDDEMWTLRNMYTSDWGELFRVAFDDYWPPLHYIILNSVARVTSTELFWLRLPSVLFGAASVAAAYWLGTVLFRNRIAALVAAGLLAGLTTHVLYSQEARVYSLQILLVILSAGFFYRAYWERRISPAFIIATCLLTYAHSFASWYFIAAECVYVVVAWLIWRDRRAAIRGFFSQVIVLVLWLPLVAFFAHARLSRDIVIPSYWATGEEQPWLIVALLELYQGLGVRSYAGAGFLVLFFALAFWLAWRTLDRQPAEAVAAAPREPGQAKAVVFLACWISVPVLFSLVVSTFTSMSTFGEIRYHMTVAPALCLMAAGGFVALRARSLVIAGALLVILLPAAELPRYYFGFHRDAMDEAAALVLEHGRPGEIIYAGNGYRVFAYYYRDVFPRIGSAQWDSLTAAHAYLADRSTLRSPKWGDTYAYEKMPPEVRYYGYHVYEDRRYARFVPNEVARGGFTGSYWIVLETNARGARLLAALEANNVVCDNVRTYPVRGLEVMYCNPPPD